MKGYNMGENATWRIEENNFCKETSAKQQSIFTVGNGYIGLRGEFEEAYTGELKNCTVPGIYINGFYEIGDIVYGEKAFGFPETSQTMLSVCNAKSIEVYIDGQRFHLGEGKIISYHRELDMKKGVVTRQVVWEAPNGKEIAVDILRLASFMNPHVVIITYRVTSINFAGDIKIVTAIDTTVVEKEETDDPRVAEKLENPLQVEKIEFHNVGKDRVSCAKQRTTRTKFELSCVASDKLDKEYEIEEYITDKKIVSEYTVYLREKECVTLTRTMVYVTSNHFTRYVEETALAEMSNALSIGVSGLRKQQEEYLADFWKYADIQIKNNEELTQVMRFNIYQLLQSVGRDGYSSICAKGLSGEGYGGHYFWESETYILPVFLLSKPEIARKMLEYRYHILDNARHQAKLLGHQKGALYAWRSINGDECSAYFPAGSAQYHISADIALAVKKYFDATGDKEFLVEYGTEILIETARLWIDTGHYDALRNNQFCIDDVTGPDEYTALVNNNCYTNAMARENLYNAIWAVEEMENINRQKANELLIKLNFQRAELEEFKKAADHMYLPYDEKLQLYKQDDTFLNKKVLDLSTIPTENKPLLIHYHPLFIYRHQVCKQADLVLAEFLLPNRFDLEQKRRDFNYYEKVTTHDSSLSASVFSIMASEIGNLEKAYEYFLMTAKTDLDDLQRNTKDGLHMANMAGTWATVIHGFGGLRIVDGQIYLNPILPRQWEGYSFNIRFQNKRIEVKVDKGSVSYKLTEGNEIQIYHNQKELTLQRNVEVVYELSL